MAKALRLKLGKRKQLKLEGWVSSYVQPGNKFWKRIASKAARRADHASGAGHKRTFGHFEWS